MLQQIDGEWVFVLTCLLHYCYCLCCTAASAEFKDYLQRGQQVPCGVLDEVSAESVIESLHYI